MNRFPIPSSTHLFAAITAFAGGFGMITMPWGQSVSADAIRVAILYWVYSAVVQSLPAPDAKSSQFYRFAYKFLNLVGSNLKHAGWMDKYLPQDPSTNPSTKEPGK